MGDATNLRPQGVVYQDVRLVEIHPYQVADLMVWL